MCEKELRVLVDCKLAMPKDANVLRWVKMMVLNRSGDFQSHLGLCCWPIELCAHFWMPF